MPHPASNLFFRRPRLLVLTLLLILVTGFSSLQVIPRAEDPELTDRFATVFTFYPGASAKRVEALITERLEDEMHEIEEIKLIHSTSRANISTLILELSDTVYSDTTDEVWSRVRARLIDAHQDLPEGVAEPKFTEISNMAWTMVVALRWDLPGKPDRMVLARLGAELGDAMRAVAGTQRVNIYGEAEEEVRVDIDPADLAAMGLTVADVSRAIRNSDSKIPAGQVHGAKNRLLVEVSGELDSLARIRDLPLHGGANGRFLRLGDVATVSLSYRSPSDTLALIGGEECVAVAARMQTSLRIDTWAAASRGKIDAFRAQLPRGISIHTVFDQSSYTEQRLGGLLQNFTIAALLVTLVIFFSMGWRSAILVGSALPITTLMVLQGLNTFGIPIHQMSITGLIIALGLLIDNAIVIVDEVRHRLDDGLGARAAVAESVRGLFVPLLGSTVTTVLAFMPIVLMPGPAGEFVGGIAKSVMLALISSFFLAMTVVPAMAGLLDHIANKASGDRGGNTSRPRSWLRDGVSHRGLTARYQSALLWLIHRPVMSLTLGMILPIFGFAVFGQLPEQFFPPSDRDQFQIELRLPWQASIEQTRREALAVRTELLKNPAIEDVHWFLGESGPKVYYNMFENLRGVGFYGKAVVKLHSSHGGLQVIRDVQTMLDNRFGRAQLQCKQLEQGPPFDAPVEMRLLGPDIAVLRELGEQLRQVLTSIPGVTHTRVTMEGGQPKLMLDLDEEGARQAGFDNQAIARWLQSGLQGQSGGSMLRGTEDLPVRVRIREDLRQDVRSLHSTDLGGIGGHTPLNALASLRLVADTANIPHRGGVRCNHVRGMLVAGMLPSIALDELQRRLQASEFEVPPGYRLEVGGESAERDQAVGKLIGAAFVLMVLMAASMVLSFNSFRNAAIIAGVGICSIGLSMLALWLFAYPFGFMAIIGTMGLIGVAVNDSIVVLAALRKNQAAMAGNHAAVVQTVMRATRHLVSTSLTTMAGFAPLILAGGGFWPPVAVAIGGGVAGATLLAVTFVPTCFLLLNRPQVARR